MIELNKNPGKKSVQNLGKPFIPLPSSKKPTSSTSFLQLHKNINPFGGSYFDYPSLNDYFLKEKYLKFLNHEAQRNAVSNYPLLCENIFFTNGISDGIEMLIKTFCETSEKVAIASPTFELYEYIARIYNIPAELVTIYDEHLNLLDSELNKLAINNAKIIFLCSPNNPTGHIIPIKLVTDLLNIINSNTLLVVDEAYIEFSGRPSLSYLISNYKNLVVLRTFSKAWGLAGIRLGAILADEIVIDLLKIARIPFSISTPCMQLLESALDEYKNVYKNCDKISTLRDNLVSVMKLFDWLKTYNTNANFFLVSSDHSNELYNFLFQEMKILVSKQNHLLKNFLRISIGNNEQNEILISAFREFESNKLGRKNGKS